MTEPIGPDDAEVDRVVEAALADPAIQAASEQLGAASRDGRPMDAEQEEAIRVVLRVLIRYSIDGFKIPPGQVPAVLAEAARLFRQAPGPPPAGQ